VRIDLVFDKNTFCNSQVSRLGKSQFVPIKHIQQVEERHVFLHGKLSKFGTGASCPLFLVRIVLVFEWNTSSIS
jgi:hypothetical protein